MCGGVRGGPRSATGRVYEWVSQRLRRRSACVDCDIRRTATGSAPRPREIPGHCSAALKTREKVEIKTEEKRKVRIEINII